MTDRDQLRRLLADTASLPGRWHWAGNAKHHTVTLSTWVPGYGRVDVLSCRRAGMHGAEFRFRDPDSMMLQPVRELVQYEVCHAATSPDDPRVYRHDIDDVRHPDARLIVAAVNALPGLLDALDAAEAEVKQLRESIEELADRLERDSSAGARARWDSAYSAAYGDGYQDGASLGAEGLRRLLDGGAS